MERPRRNDLHKLDVYRCALELYRRIARMVAGFPRGEADLSGQMRRSSQERAFQYRGRSGQARKGESRSIRDCARRDEGIDRRFGLRRDRQIRNER